MADIGSLIVRIGADASELHREFNKLADSSKSFGDRLATASKIAATAIATVTSSLVATTLSIASQVEETESLSQKTGIATKTLQGWSVAMAENNFQAQSLAAGMRTLSKEMLEAQNPATAAADAFTAIGLSASSLDSTESAIRAIADRFATMADGPEKAALAIQLFGRAGLDMIPILNRGAAAFDESRHAAERFGLVLSQDQVAAMTAVDDAADRLQVAFRGLMTQISVSFAPSLTSFIARMTDAVAALTRSVMDLAGAMQTYGKIHPQEQLGRDIIERAQQIAKEEEQLNGELQERLGEKAKVLGLEQQRSITARAKAQEELGRTQLAIIQRERMARNQAFAEQVEEQERLRVLALDLQKPPDSGPFVAQLKHKEEALRNLARLMPELNREDAIEAANEQERAGLKIVQQSMEAYAHRNDELDRQVLLTTAADREQQAMYQQERAALGASDAARQTRFAAIEAQGLRERQLIEETIFDEENKHARIIALDSQLDAQRRQTIQQYPSFVEQQLQAVVNSNVFSVSQIVTAWTSGLANAIVQWNSFTAIVKSAWTQTLTTLIQGVLNFFVQWGAQAALSQLQQLGMLAATEQAKVATVALANGQILTITTTTAAATTSIWAGAGAAMLGVFASVSAGFTALAAGLVATITAVGTFIMGVLSAIATALTATVFGIPWAGAILLGIAAIAGALAATGNLGFREGGVGDFGSGTQATLHGREAVIPLNERGADFMEKALGGRGRGGQQTIIFQLDSRELARLVEPSLRDLVYLRVGT